jgi:hypothetical protein
MLAALAAGLLCVAPPNPEDEKTNWFGLQLAVDAGVPDGLGVGLALAPVPHVRVSVSGLTNIMGAGIRGGLSLVPFASWTLHPILSLDWGRYFTGDARMFVAEAPAKLTYDFVDATLGLELMFRVVVLRAGGGVARIWAPDVGVDGTLPAAKLALAFRFR